MGLAGDRIAFVGEGGSGEEEIDAGGLALSPGFIDVHTHDDLAVLRAPEMLPKLTQGVTTCVVGNCGISAAPVFPRGAPPDPMSLLGEPEEFVFPTFAAYVAAVETARPAVNVAALVGHTALRNNHLDRLDREAGPSEIAAMRAQLEEALAHGALGLSTGLAYLSAFSATTEEVVALAGPLAEAGGLYASHVRDEGAGIADALDEALRIGRLAGVPVVVSHLKCAGFDNWGRSGEVLALLDAARAEQRVGWDGYPYAASSSTLDLRQVDERIRIVVTWSDPHPEMAGRTLAEIAHVWETTQIEAARRLRPAGAIYHGMDEADVRAILRHPATMIGSDGLPCDPRPHPRLWGTFPRVLGHYARDLGLFPLAEAVHRMTGLPARRFGLGDRGAIALGQRADLVLFDPATVADAATWDKPMRPARGLRAIWVNGLLAYGDGGPTGARSGRFLPRQTRAGWE